MDRISLFFIPVKHQPDYVYLRHVPLKRVHLFTALQVAGLVILWIIKKSENISIAFPVMVALIIIIRKCFEWFRLFSSYDLMWLDE